MLHAWDHENKKIAEAKGLVIQGKKSPVFYYMKKCLMDVKLLSSYTGFSGFKVKRHFKPNNFNKLTDTELDKYVYAFGLKEKKDLFKID
ncbi:MAG: hypothetical protein HC906_08035 [Bacteroidales bacterium]|nr:hypothetical protein [Bacteroidales bacterium]